MCPYRYILYPDCIQMDVHMDSPIYIFFIDLFGTKSIRHMFSILRALPLSTYKGIHRHLHPRGAWLT